VGRDPQRVQERDLQPEDGGYTIPGYAALHALFLNILIAVIATAIFKAVDKRAPKDATAPADCDDEVVAAELAA
jgi:hypothetical protein